MIKQKVAPAALSRVPPRLWSRVLRAPLAAPYYHIVGAGDAAHVRHLYRYRSVGEFRSDIDFFLRHFSFITLPELIEYLDGERELRSPSALLTFDDGFREMYDVVAPILLEKGVPATFFLATDFLDNKDLAHHNKLSLLIEQLENDPSDVPRKEVDTYLSSQGRPADDHDLRSRLLSIDARDHHLVDELARRCACDFGEYLASHEPYLTSEQVKELLRQGFHIGAHSVDHPLYAHLTLEEQLHQTRESMRVIEESFSPGYRAFAFPHSDRDVSVEFFREAFSGIGLDVSFGTARMTRHFFPRNVERFSMEQTDLPARQIVAREYGRCAYRTLTGRRSARLITCGT